MIQTKTEYKILVTAVIENSSNIVSISYTDIEALVVQFKNGGQYLYKKVPKKTYETMAKAESVGKYLKASIMGKFEYEKIETLPKKEEALDEV